MIFFTSSGNITVNHYKNTPIEIYRKFHLQKLTNWKFKKNSDIFHIPAQNIDCGYLLEPSRFYVFWAEVVAVIVPKFKLINP